MERDLERSFVEEERSLGRQPNGWPPALLFFHIAQWRERLRGALTDFHSGREFKPPPANIDEFNDVELSAGHAVSLSESYVRADAALAALIDFCPAVGEQPFTWYITRTTGDALVRNSYFHPRVHIAAYWQENHDAPRAHDLVERTVCELRELWPSPLILGAGLYNLAGVRVAQGRHDDALTLLVEAAPMRPDIISRAGADEDLAPLRDDARFRKLTATA